MSAPTPEHLAELRRELDDMRGLALREGVYNGNRAVLNIIERVEPLLDAAAERDALAAKLAEVRALHQAYMCEECREDPSREGCREDPSCEACDSMTYPCPTIRALDATPETGGES